jgi:hypothetical protein
MQRLIVIFGVAAVIAAAFAGSAPARGASAPTGIAHSATGSAETFVGGIPHGRTLSFSAIQLSDGSVYGQARVINHVNGFESVIDITCLHVVDNAVLADGTTGNFAEVAGIVVQQSDGDVGSMRSFNMLDTGQGANSPPDLINVFTWGSDPGTSCEDAYPPMDPEFLVPVEDGNVQVS